MIVLKRDAVAKVVLNNLYKHTQLQDNFGANMLALVDGVPRTLSLDAFIRHWVTHQIEVIVRRTRFRLRKAEERAHILRGLLKALDALDEVIALIRRRHTVEAAREGLMGLLEIDEVQANAILEMQLRRLAALERQKIIDEHAELEAKINEYNAILASPKRAAPDRQRGAGGDRREVRRRPAHQDPGAGFDGDMSIEDLIAEEDIVVTITRGGYVKRTRTDDYRSQKRGGKGVRGAKLRGGRHRRPLLRHHDAPLAAVLHQQGPGLPGQGVRAARGRPRRAGSARSEPAGVPAGRADRPGAGHAGLPAAPYLVLATKRGLVKKTPLEDYDSTVPAGVIAINLREGDELSRRGWSPKTDDLMLVCRQGQSLRFTATDEALRPMGRATSGVKGMRFREDDELFEAWCATTRSSSPSPMAATPSGPRPTNTASRAAAAWVSRWASTKRNAGTWSAR